jgi:hypothetical protein
VAAQMNNNKFSRTPNKSFDEKNDKNLHDSGYRCCHRTAAFIVCLHALCAPLYNCYHNNVVYKVVLISLMYMLKTM